MNTNDSPRAIATPIELTKKYNWDLRRAIERWETDGGSAEEPIKTFKETQPIKKLLTLDYEMIMEGMRRLQGGTFRLLDEDKISAMELFGQIRAAFKEHVSFEEEILPLIAERSHDSKMGEFCFEMKRTHVNLFGLLDAAEFELGEARAIPFKAVITALKQALQNHLALEALIPYEQWATRLNKETLTRLRKRASVGFIGSQQDFL